MPHEQLVHPSPYPYPYPYPDASIHGKDGAHNVGAWQRDIIEEFTDVERARLLRAL